MDSQNSQRPRFQIHLVTMFVLSIALAVLLLLNFSPTCYVRDDVFMDFTDSAGKNVLWPKLVTDYGWPCRVCRRSESLGYLAVKRESGLQPIALSSILSFGETESVEVQNKLRAKGWIPRPKPAEVPAYKHTMWNDDKLIINGLVAFLVLASITLLSEHFVRRRSTRIAQDIE
jgi:hypothetical protein